MPAAPLPDDEAGRLDALLAYAVLDTPSDPRVDVFVRVAAGMYGVPISLVTLVDSGRSWSKAAFGLEPAAAPREHAFCAHAILRPQEVMVVDDLAGDPRFAANPLVTGAPGVRFYAGAPICSPDGHALGTLCILDRTPRTLDAAGRRHLQELAVGVGAVLDLHRTTMRLHRAATHDPLTGLANRAGFEPALQDAVEAARDGAPCAVLCLDLDGFKQVNDRLGHAAGDAVLRAAAARLQDALRPGDLAVRLGGDEFAVLLRGPFAPDLPRTLARRLIDAFNLPLHLDGAELRVPTSIGYAVTRAGTDAATLLRNADAALYRAKAAGRGAAAGHGDPPAAPRPGSLAVPTLHADLRDAIDTGAFTLVWQPYHDLLTGRVCGHEALLRWLRPGHGPVAPDVFIAEAEAGGLTHDLDAWVLDAACHAAQAWPMAHDVAVNITPSSFCAAGFPAQVARALARTGLAPGRLMLEVTERMAIDRPDLARQRILELHGLGVKVALDDFGSGYSALACLKDFAFDKVKLDREFIRDVGHGKAADTQDLAGQRMRSEAIARAVIGLGRSIGVPVCAEGVETEGQLAFLIANGCHMAQGFLLGRPVRDPAAGISIWTRMHAAA